MKSNLIKILLSVLFFSVFCFAQKDNNTLNKKGKVNDQLLGNITLWDSTLYGLKIGSLMKWNGSDWQDCEFYKAKITHVELFQSDGKNLFLAGYDKKISNSDFKVIFKWDGDTLTQLGRGILDPLIAHIYTMKIYNGDVYIVSRPPKSQIMFLTKWNGNTWEPVADGLSMIYQTFDLLIQNGEFYLGTVKYVFKWNGFQWKNLVGENYNPKVKNYKRYDSAYSLFLINSDLIAGGIKHDWDGNPISNGFAMWDGKNWKSFLSGNINGNILSAVVVGNDIYFAGEFSDISGNNLTRNIAKWNGTSWEALGDGLNNSVHQIIVDGDQIIVYGTFTDAGGNPNADNIACWNGTSWQAFGNGL